jgi:hypothetical protein
MILVQIFFELMTKTAKKNYMLFFSLEIKFNGGKKLFITLVFFSIHMIVFSSGLN